MALGRPYEDNEADRDVTDRSDFSDHSNVSGASGYHDYSEPQPPQPNTRSTSAAHDLSAREQSAGGTNTDALSNPKTKDTKADAFGLSKAEHQSPLNYTPSTAGSARGKMTAKAKRKVLVWIIGGVGGVGIGAGLLGGPSLLLNTINAKISDGILNVQQSVMTDHTARIYSSSLAKGACVLTGKLCQKFHSMSSRQVGKLQEAGYKLYDSAGKEVPAGAKGRQAVAELEPPPDVKLSGGADRLTASNITKEMSGNPGLRSSLHKVYNPKFAGFSDRIFAKVMVRAHTGKSPPLPEGGDEGKMQAAMEKAVNEGESPTAKSTYTSKETGEIDADGNKIYEVVDENGNPALGDDGKSPITGTRDEVNAQASDLNTAADNVSSTASTAEKSGASAIEAAERNMGQSFLQKAAATARE